MIYFEPYSDRDNFLKSSFKISNSYSPESGFWWHDLFAREKLRIFLGGYFFSVPGIFILVKRHFQRYFGKEIFVQIKFQKKGKKEIVYLAVLALIDSANILE